MLAAQRDIAVVSANLGLRALGHRVAGTIDTQVHRRLAPAFAHRFQLDEIVGNRQQRSTTGEQLPPKISAQAIGEHRNAIDIGQLRELIHTSNNNALKLDALAHRVLALETDKNRRDGAASVFHSIIKSPAVAWIISAVVTVWALLSGRTH